MKRFLYYFTWTIGIGVFIYFGLKYQIHIEEKAKMEFQLLPVVRFAIIFPVLIGLVLRLPKLIMEIKEKRLWTFDWVRFVAIALPSLIIILMAYLPFTSFGGNLVPLSQIMLIGGPTITTVAGIVFGYVLLDCLKK
ncbi:hypothetical protein QGM71_08315 [Virgibacillus sp. C22-A2]|uniref:Permease n=1 Tax=Virgibacillus tibetensis TaxID=3042313 RepID=A0ABU6KGD5_9BACI|nr:hypothetical protein [Virgibacillus sp. C22-A2]